MSIGIVFCISRVCGSISDVFVSLVGIALGGSTSFSVTCFVDAFVHCKMYWNVWFRLQRGAYAPDIQLAWESCQYTIGVSCVPGASFV